VCLKMCTVLLTREQATQHSPSENKEIVSTADKVI
jgi:hypothetical protein